MPLLLFSWTKQERCLLICLNLSLSFCHFPLAFFTLTLTLHNWTEGQAFFVNSHTISFSQSNGVFDFFYYFSFTNYLQCWRWRSEEAFATLWLSGNLQLRRLQFRYRWYIGRICTDSGSVRWELLRKTRRKGLWWPSYHWFHWYELLNHLTLGVHSLLFLLFSVRVISGTFNLI